MTSQQWDPDKAPKTERAAVVFLCEQERDIADMITAFDAILYPPERKHVLLVIPPGSLELSNAVYGLAKAGKLPSSFEIAHVPIQPANFDSPYSYWIRLNVFAGYIFDKKRSGKDAPKGKERLLGPPKYDLIDDVSCVRHVSLFLSHDRPDPYIWLKLQETNERISAEIENVVKFLQNIEPEYFTSEKYKEWRLRSKRLWKELRNFNSELYNAAKNLLFEISPKIMKKATSLVETGRAQNSEEAFKLLNLPPMLHTEIVQEMNPSRWLEIRGLVGRGLPVPLGFAIHHFDLIAASLTGHHTDIIVGGSRLANCFTLEGQRSLAVEACQTRRKSCNLDHAEI